MAKRLGPMTYSDLTARAKTERWTGVLTVKNPEVCEHVVFKDGKVMGFSSEERKKLIGQILTEAGKIDRKQIEEALLRQRKSKGAMRLGDILVEMELISRQALEETIALHQMSVLANCLTEVAGVLTFEPGASLPKK